MIALSCCPSANAQTTVVPEKTITVNESDLTPDQLAKIKAEKELKMLEDKISHYGKWVGVGSEIGSVIREGLFAVKDVAVEFSGTNVGKFTMYLIAWKVMGKDAVRIIIGILLIIICSISLPIFYKNQFGIKKIAKTKVPLIRRLWDTNIEYEIIKPVDYDGDAFVKFLYMLLFVGQFGIAYAIMFGGM